ncbi:hypothetical protein STEG23_002674, partial [Scotinomys teguina]
MYHHVFPLHSSSHTGSHWESPYALYRKSTLTSPWGKMSGKQGLHFLPPYVAEKINQHVAMEPIRAAAIWPLANKISVLARAFRWISLKVKSPHTSILTDTKCKSQLSLCRQTVLFQSLLPEILSQQQEKVIEGTLFRQSK